MIKSAGNRHWYWKSRLCLLLNYCANCPIGEDEAFKVLKPSVPFLGKLRGEVKFQLPRKDTSMVRSGNAAWLMWRIVDVLASWHEIRMHQRTIDRYMMRCVTRFLKNLSPAFRPGIPSTWHGARLEVAGLSSVTCHSQGRRDGAYFVSLSGQTHVVPNSAQTCTTNGGGERIPHWAFVVVLGHQRPPKLTEEIFIMSWDSMK